MIVFNFYACMFWLFGTKHWGGGGGGGGPPRPPPSPAPGGYGQLCLSRQKLMHVLNEDAHFDLY